MANLLASAVWKTFFGADEVRFKLLMSDNDFFLLP